jgi:aminoglycoside phosphotransferase (APT) family kinase protein
VHGDFHRGNVAIHDDRSVIFDWTDACIAHPFVDLLTFLDMSGPPTTDATVRDRLLDRYLESWTDVMPRRDAAALFRRTEPFITMHHVISYQEILTHLDPTERWQWESHVPWWLDKALAGFA